MKHLWNYINKKSWKLSTKYRFAFIIPAIFSALAGLAAWLIIRNLALSTLDWMFCFIGYPVVISVFVVLLYSYRHDLHD